MLRRELTPFEGIVEMIDLLAGRKMPSGVTSSGTHAKRDFSLGLDT